MPSTETHSTPRGVWPSILVFIAYVAAILGSILAAMHFQLGWIGTLLVMLGVGGGGTILLANFVARLGERGGAGTAALRRYNRRMIVSTFAYILALFAAVYLHKEWRPAGIAAWLVGLLPSAGVAGMLWTMARLLGEESDEYIRTKLIQQALFATGFLLFVATIWGFFEQFGLVPHVPSWAALPVFALAVGLSSGLKWIRV